MGNGWAKRLYYICKLRYGSRVHFIYERQYVWWRRRDWSLTNTLTVRSPNVDRFPSSSFRFCIEIRRKNSFSLFFRLHPMCCNRRSCMCAFLRFLYLFLGWNYKILNQNEKIVLITWAHCVWIPHTKEENKREKNAKRNALLLCMRVYLDACVCAYSVDVNWTLISAKVNRGKRKSQNRMCMECWNVYSAAYSCTVWFVCVCSLHTNTSTHTPPPRSKWVRRRNKKNAPESTSSCEN